MIEVSIRKDEIQHKNEGSFEEFWESERKEEQDIKNIDKDLDVNLPNPIAQTKNLLLKVNENVTSKEEFVLEFETFQLMNYYYKKEYIQQQDKYLLLFSMQ